MAERLKATVSKIVVRFFRTEGSNPSLSAIYYQQFTEVLNNQNFRFFIFKSCQFSPHFAMNIIA